MESLDAATKILGFVAAAIGLAGIFAFVGAYYRVDLAKKQIEGLRGDVADYGARTQRLEDERDEWQSKYKSSELKAEQLQTKVIILEGVVRHDSKIQQLIDVVTAHDQNVEVFQEQNIRAHQELVSLLTKILERTGQANAG